MSIQYKALDPAMNNHSAFLTLTYSQLQTVANALWNFYAILEASKTPEKTNTIITIEEIRDWSKAHEQEIQGVHDAFVNCTLALEKSYQAEKKE